MIYKMNYQSPIGPLTIASDGRNIVGLWMDGQKYYGGSVDSIMTIREDLPVFQLTRGWLDKYFAGKRPDISDLPLAPNGSEFRKSIWKQLCEIPYGSVVTYGDIAKKLGCKSAQAIGGAVGHNPISVIIPCHRVVGTSGSLTGYAGGMAKKMKLLESEGVDLSKFRVPTSGTAI
mgnify:CR=1 FL=1